MQKAEKFSSIILRIGIGIVIIWFGLQQLANPVQWLAFLPTWTKSLPLDQIKFIYLNGWFEIVFGILLVIGLYTRLVTLFLGLHLLGIVLSVGYVATGVRDFGLTIALFSIFLHGESDWSLDQFLDRIEKNGKTI